MLKHYNKEQNLEEVEEFNCLDTIVKNDGTPMKEMEPMITMAKLLCAK